MNGAITIEDQRPRHIRRVSGTPPCGVGIGLFPWPVIARGQAADRHCRPVPRAKQRRLLGCVVIDATAWLEVPRHAHQGAARAPGGWADRADAGRRKPQTGRCGHLRAVCRDVARHRRVQGKMYSDSRIVRPVARKNTDTPTVSGWHACRVSSRRMTQFCIGTDTPAVSVEQVFDPSLTRPPCRFIDIPSAGRFTAVVSGLRRRHQGDRTLELLWGCRSQDGAP